MFLYFITTLSLPDTSSFLYYSDEYVLFRAKATRSQRTDFMEKEDIVGPMGPT